MRPLRSPLPTDEAPAGLLLDGLENFWLAHGFGNEARVAAETYLDFVADGVPEDLAGLLGAGEILRFTGALERARENKRSLIALAREEPDAPAGDRLLGYWLPALLSDLSTLELELGDLDAAHIAAREALQLRRARGDPVGIAHALHALSEVAFVQGSLDDAARAMAEAIQLQEPDVLAYSRAGLAQIEATRGRADDCAQQLSLALPDLDPLRDLPSVSAVARTAGHLAHLRGDPETAVTLLRAGRRIEAETGTQFSSSNDRRIWSEALEEAEQALSPGALEQSSTAADRLSPEAVLHLVADVAPPQ